MSNMSYKIYTTINVERNFGYLKIDEADKVLNIITNNRESNEVILRELSIEELPEDIIKINSHIIPLMISKFNSKDNFFVDVAESTDSLEFYLDNLDIVSKNQFIMKFLLHIDYLSKFYVFSNLDFNNTLTYLQRQVSVRFDSNGYQKDWRYFDEVYFMEDYHLVYDFDIDTQMVIKISSEEGDYDFKIISKQEFNQLTENIELQSAKDKKFQELDDYMDSVCLKFKIVYNNNYIFKSCDSLFAFLGPRLTSNRDTFKLIMLNQKGEKVKFNNTPKQIIPIITGEIISYLDDASVYDIKTEHQKAIFASNNIEYVNQYDIKQEVIIDGEAKKFPITYHTITLAGIDLT